MNCNRFQTCLKRTMTPKIQSDKGENSTKKNKRLRKKKRKPDMAPCENQSCEKNCILFSDKRSILSCTEKGKMYTLDLNNLGFQASCFRIDGGVIDSLECNKCDFAFFIKDGFDSAVFVELKGKDVRHAIDQLNKTLSLDAFVSVTDTYKKIYGRIVVRSCVPNIQADNKVLNLKKKFAGLGGNLKIKELKFVEKYSDLNRV